MKRSEMLKEIKAIIRACAHELNDWSYGKISYGTMSERLAEVILEHIEDQGMISCEWEKE